MREIGVECFSATEWMHYGSLCSNKQGQKDFVEVFTHMTSLPSSLLVEMRNVSRNLLDHPDNDLHQFSSKPSPDTTNYSLK